MDARENHAKHIFDLGLLRLGEDKPEAKKPPIDAIDGRDNRLTAPQDDKSITR
jgi:hypothetical protein